MGFEEIIGQRLETGEQDERRQRRPLPNVDEDERRQRRRGRGEQAARAAEAPLNEPIADEAIIGEQEAFEDEADGERRDRDGDEDGMRMSVRQMRLKWSSGHKAKAMRKPSTGPADFSL